MSRILADTMCLMSRICCIHCYWVWTNDYCDTGVAGCIVYKAKSPLDEGQFVMSNETPSDEYSLADTHIFLPAAGYCHERSLENAGSEGNYWSASFNRAEDYGEWSLFFDSENGDHCFVERCYGLNVRAACD